MVVSEVRGGRRRRIAGLVAAVAVMVGGCGDSKDGGALGDGSIRSVTVITHGADLSQTIDAAMSPDGRDVYFTATGPQGPGVFHIPASGGVPALVVAGDPFRAPVGIATDGARIYVADPEAQVGSRTGAIFSLPVGGGKPAVVLGSEGTVPRGLEVVRDGGTETLYFAGKDAGDGTAGVFRLDAGGAAAPTVVAKGAPFSSPDAVTVAKDGTVYATDRGASDGAGAVYRVTAGSAAKVAGIRAPVLAGVSLTLDESLLLVSSLSDKGTDQVLLVDLRTDKTGVFSRTIGENRAGAGLHRARDVNVFVWADVQRPGRIYRIDP